jgi:chromate reductase, NAD(P)H dehydrogenase (quinone)
MKILGLSGSLRRDSYNARLLRAAASELPPEAELVMWDGVRELPYYDEDIDNESAPDSVRSLRDAVSEADALLISTPEYNASIPGALKNAIDWASRPRATTVLKDKPVLVIGATTGLFGAVWAQAELRKVLKTAGANPLEEEVPVGQAHEAFGDDGGLRDPDLREALTDAVRALVREVAAPAEDAAVAA